MGLVGMLLGLMLMMWLAYRGWSVLIAAPAAALLAAAISGEPLLANWTQTFMGGAASFVMRWLPMFLLGGLFGKLMEDSGSISSIARSLTEKLGTQRTILAVVLASAVVTYGGVSVFVAFFVLVPMALDMFKNANLPRRLMPATIGLGAFTFTMSAMPGTPSVNNAIPMPYFGTTAFAAPGLGIIASVIIMVIGMWWLRRAERIAGFHAGRRRRQNWPLPAAPAVAGTDQISAQESVGLPGISGRHLIPGIAAAEDGPILELNHAGVLRAALGLGPDEFRLGGPGSALVARTHQHEVAVRISVRVAGRAGFAAVRRAPEGYQ